MVEDKEIIHNRMLNNIPPIYDRGEGSYFYDATKPVAIECEKLNEKADKILSRSFAKTAINEDLDIVCEEEGVYRKKATKGSGYVLIKGAVGSLINKGDLVASDNLNFICMGSKVIDTTGFCNVKVECEKEGITGNVPVGAIKYFPITLQGLTSVSNLEAFTNGYDKEDDESLRERYFIKVRTPGTSGNINHYKQWALECIGVGGVEVFPLFYGAGTVRLVLMDSNRRSVNKELIDKVYNNIEAKRPIGAKVSVESAIEKIININVKIVLDEGFKLEDIKKDFIKNLEKYLYDNAFKSTYLSIAKVGSILLGTLGIIDYSNLQINNSSQNIPLEKIEIPILGSIVMEV